MNKLIIFSLLIFLFGCKLKPEKRKMGDRIVEAIFINDSIADGVVKYYTIDGKLEGHAQIKNGKKNGVFIYFYPNGKVFDSISYLDDLANGYHYRYDTHGNLSYQDFYTNGKKVGEKLTYDSGKLVKYEFVDSNGILLYSSDYDVRGLRKWKFKSIINMNCREVFRNGFKQIHMQFYWLNPPQVAIKYSLGIADTVRHIDKTLKELSKSGIIKDTVLPILTYPFCYYISVGYFNNNNKFSRVYIQEF